MSIRTVTRYRTNFVQHGPRAWDVTHTCVFCGWATTQRTTDPSATTTAIRRHLEVHLTEAVPAPKPRVRVQDDADRVARARIRARLTIAGPNAREEMGGILQRSIAIVTAERRAQGVSAEDIAAEVQALRHQAAAHLRAVAA